jgi:hypothetical protein
MPEASEQKTTTAATTPTSTTSPAAAATWQLPDGIEDHLTMGACVRIDKAKPLTRIDESTAQVLGCVVAQVDSDTLLILHTQSLTLPSLGSLASMTTLRPCFP